MQTFRVHDALGVSLPKLKYARRNRNTSDGIKRSHTSMIGKRKNGGHLPKHVRRATREPEPRDAIAIAISVVEIRLRVGPAIFEADDGLQIKTKKEQTDHTRTRTHMDVRRKPETLAEGEQVAGVVLFLLSALSANTAATCTLKNNR